MANNGPIPNFQPRDTTVFLCKDCGVCFDSADSLDVHRQYHKENLLMKWANQAAQANGQTSETNNNNAKSVSVKREFVSSIPSTIAAAADSSDTTTMKSTNKSPDSYNSSATPEMTTPAGHPATPQSYHSAPSPYQNPEPTNFSPSFHNFHVKPEVPSPGHYPNYAPNPQFNDNQYFNMEPPQSQLPYQQEYQNKQQSHSGQYRFHPYGNAAQFERNAQVSSSSNHSPSYVAQNPQPTSSPSPKQCDKCGFVCETAGQLMEHLQMAHPSTPFNQQTPFQFPSDAGEPKVKQEDEPQAEILDLDSQKVHVYQTPEEQEDALKRQQAELAALNGGHHPHSVSSMLAWPNAPHQQKLFAQQNNHEHRMFSNGTEQNMYTNIKEEKLFSNAHDPKLFQPHQMHNPDFLPNSTTSHDAGNPNIGVPNMNAQPQVPHAYRPYEHIPVQPNPPVISSTQVPNTHPPANITAPVAKGANWKSNEARRPKTYNCSACNKWFTSSGHLKRHYNTTLHKNAVKSSGQPDPATLPISAHHHPSRDPNHQATRQQQQHQDTNTQSPIPMQLPTPTDESNSDDNGLAPAYERTQHPGLLQQPPSGPYDRHPPNIVGPPPNMHSSLSQNPSLSNSLSNLSSGSPPNGEAGPSANNLEHSRGLQSTSISTNIQHQLTPLSQIVSNIPPSNQLPPFNLLNQQQHMMGIHSPPPTNQIFHPMGPPQISANYPNGLSPHVTPTTMVTNNQLQALISLTTTGEYHQEQYLEIPSDGPLPSFAQFTSLLSGLSPGPSNVGGPSPATDSHLSYQQYAVYPHAEQPEFISVGDEESILRYSQNFSPETQIVYRAHAHPQQQQQQQEYQITVLQPVDQNIPQQVKQPDHYSPTNQNNNHFAQNTQKFAPVHSLDQSPSPEGEIQNENNLETGDPLITSTGSPLSARKQVSAAGVHKCIDCDKTFNKACYLTQHNKTFHSGDKPFKCNRCGKRFPDEDSYQSHLKKHAGEKPHKCEQCPKQFNHKTDLRRHMCLHSGLKPFVCETCGKGFIRKDHMLKHCDTHLRKQKGLAHQARNAELAQTVVGYP